MPEFYKWPPAFRVFHQIPVCPIRATFYAHLSLLDLISRMIFGDEYRG